MEEEQLLTPIAQPSTDDDQPPILRRSKKKSTKKQNTAKEMVEIVVVALVLGILIRIFLVEMFWIPTKSMADTLKVDDRVIVTKFSYWFDEPQRGDVVVFKYPGDPDERTDYIKRVIGLPGEIIEFKDSQLYVNGVMVGEPYLEDGLVFVDFGPITVPDEEYFVCGDNRNNSNDSRHWGFVSHDKLMGQAQCIYWPFERIVGL